MNKKYCIQNDLLVATDQIHIHTINPKGHTYCFSATEIHCKLHFQSTKLIIGSLNLTLCSKCSVNIQETFSFNGLYIDRKNGKKLPYMKHFLKQYSVQKGNKIQTYRLYIYLLPKAILRAVLLFHLILEVAFYYSKFYRHEY